MLFAFLQVAIFVPEDPEQPTRSIDAAAFQQLPKLNCLTVAGERDGAGLLSADNDVSWRQCSSSCPRLLPDMYDA